MQKNYYYRDLIILSLDTKNMPPRQIRAKLNEEDKLEIEKYNAFLKKLE